MSIEELKDKLRDLSIATEDSVEAVNRAATDAQTQIFNYLITQIELFENSDGNFIINQPLADRFARIQRHIEQIISRTYTTRLQEYFRRYDDVETEIIGLHKSYNELVVAKNNFTSARRAIYSQAEYYLTVGLADAYIQPAKYLLMQQVAIGGRIDDAKRILTNWDKGTIDPGKLASDRHAPRLQAYSTQIARDTIFTYQGTIQEIIKDRFALSKFIYVGGLVKDSRPFCKHLVAANRKIDLKEIPQLVLAFPQGLKPNTTMANFFEVRGGYNCNHIAMPVR